MSDAEEIVFFIIDTSVHVFPKNMKVSVYRSYMRIGSYGDWLIPKFLVYYYLGVEISCAGIS